MAVVTAPTEGRGTTTIDEKVVTRIVVSALESVPGCVGRRSGLGALTGRNFPRVDVSFDTRGDGVAVDAEIAVSWPAPVRAVAATARDTVATWLRRAVGVRPVHVNIRVAHVAVPAEGEPSVRVTRGDLLAFDTDPACRGIVRVEREPVPVRVKRGTLNLDPATLEPPALQPVRVVPSGLLHGGEVRSPAIPDAPEPRRVTAPASRQTVDVRVVGSAADRVTHVEAPEPRDPVEVRVVSRGRAIVPEAPEPRPLKLIPTPHGPRMRDVLTPRGSTSVIRPAAPDRAPVTPVVRSSAAPITPTVPRPRVIRPQAPAVRVTAPVVVPGSGLPARTRRKEGRQ